jgi:hypothetical protein
LKPPDYLKKRNALWAALRQLEPEDPKCKALLLELSDLIGWSREKIFAGLGWLEETKNNAPSIDGAHLEKT